MSKVRLEFLGWLADTLNIEGTGREVILEAANEGGKTVQDLLTELATKYPRFGQIVFNLKDSKLNDGVSIFLNGGHMELLNGLGTKLNDGDVLTLVPAMQGGGCYFI